jgi:hypothetical protein
MKSKKILISCLFMVAIGLSSCKKDSENIFNMFTDVTVTYNAASELSLTDYKLVKDGDIINIDYTITSAKEDMYSITFERAIGSTNTQTRTTTAITDPNQRRQISGQMSLKMQRDGKTSFRIYPLNQAGFFMGDGGKTLTVEVSPSYIHTVNRRVYFPDTLTRVAPSFFSIKRGEAFSYTNGQANAADIDFGLYRRLTINPTTGQITYPANIYALDANPNPLTVYDVSTWTKRLTKFSAPVTGGTNVYRNTIGSSSVIEEEAKKRTINLTQTTSNFVAGSIVYFLTPEGKYGVIHINSITKDLDGKPYADISIKTQK